MCSWRNLAAALTLLSQQLLLDISARPSLSNLNDLHSFPPTLNANFERSMQWANFEHPVQWGGTAPPAGYAGAASNVLAQPMFKRTANQGLQARPTFAASTGIPGSYSLPQEPCSMHQAIARAGLGVGPTDQLDANRLLCLLQAAIHSGHSQGGSAQHDGTHLSGVMDNFHQQQPASLIVDPEETNTKRDHPGGARDQISPMESHCGSYAQYSGLLSQKSDCSSQPQHPGLLFPNSHCGSYPQYSELFFREPNCDSYPQYSGLLTSQHQSPPSFVHPNTTGAKQSPLQISHNSSIQNVGHSLDHDQDNLKLLSPHQVNLKPSTNYEITDSVNLITDRYPPSLPLAEKEMINHHGFHHLPISSLPLEPLQRPSITLDRNLPWTGKNPQPEILNYGANVMHFQVTGSSSNSPLANQANRQTVESVNHLSGIDEKYRNSVESLPDAGTTDEFNKQHSDASIRSALMEIAHLQNLGLQPMHIDGDSPGTLDLDQSKRPALKNHFPPQDLSNNYLALSEFFPQQRVYSFGNSGLPPEVTHPIIEGCMKQQAVASLKNSALNHCVNHLNTFSYQGLPSGLHQQPADPSTSPSSADVKSHQGSFVELAKVDKIPQETAISSNYSEPSNGIHHLQTLIEPTLEAGINQQSQNLPTQLAMSHGVGHRATNSASNPVMIDEKNHQASDSRWNQELIDRACYQVGNPLGADSHDEAENVNSKAFKPHVDPQSTPMRLQSTQRVNMKKEKKSTRNCRLKERLLWEENVLKSEPKSNKPQDANHALSQENGGIMQVIQSGLDELHDLIAILASDSNAKLIKKDSNTSLPGGQDGSGRKPISQVTEGVDPFEHLEKKHSIGSKPQKEAWVENVQSAGHFHLELPSVANSGSQGNFQQLSSKKSNQQITGNYQCDPKDHLHQKNLEQTHINIPKRKGLRFRKAWPCLESVG